ncbi:fructose-2,6-bisphosphatase [Secundilactobacillus paracollinoides]|uniref:Fructose-2,6-bisphosphatase n=1 Tax=Secundilactobacillus paracollinoides TaxID=240427 RepID=A0A1B2IYB7_9LACO|nr:histidine phosphatase family protein [Secundilactobacillus paracollinoides]ANZ61155.1 fructose-2,6-bisphosphatase [Secundilactobacillus paracollinoides]ANZ64451.1 fructose-2,6-bisphosphatase [Secundilactobacillus paracollinoides]ANZ67076.1 fructose-2,6-bisphosphatase [Secundilactobacillus paracollinoides]KRL76073.1 phosphoglycerate mutase [Secundilactobacillus paracollinoides DSM 15502 = JCM 11969]
MTDFYFIRHGQTTANIQGLKQGTMNTEITELNETGLAQAANLRDHFDISFADQLVASPLNRTRQTAAILNEKAQLPVSYDERLLEISYGDWDGQKNRDLEKQYPDVFDHHLHDVLPSYVALAHGESFDTVVARVKAFMTDLASQNPDQSIIVVTHGFTVKAAAMVAVQPGNVMALPEPGNTSVTKISFDGDSGQAYLWGYNQGY